MNSVKTICPYCGVGCGLEVLPPSQKDLDQNSDPAIVPWKVKGDRSHPSSQGMVCVKGATVTESIQRDRLLHPMYRQNLDEEFQRISWDDAFNLIVNKIQNIINTKSPDHICMYGSGQFLTEDYYVAQKLMKGCLGTNNFDANSRLCMSSAVSGYIQSFGSDGPPCCYEDLELTDCCFIVGSNAAECHPIVFNRFAKYHKKNPHVKLIVADPRLTPTGEIADLYLPIQPGSDIDLFHGIAHLLLKAGSIDQNFIDNHTVNFPEYAELLKNYTPDVVSRRCGITVEQLETAVQYWQTSSKVLSLWSMGLNQSAEGTAKVRSLINLHLLTGQIGKPGSGPFSLTGQPNAMGGREAGGLAHLLPGYRLVTNPEHRADVEKFWNLPAGSISSYIGRTTWEMITGLETGDVDMLWIAATNPAVSMPDLNRTKAALRKSPFTVYQEAYYPTETASFAHLLLPATQWSEKTGVMTNSERRVTYSPGFHQPQGEALEDWVIFSEVGRRLGFPEMFTFQSPAEVHREFVQLTRDRPCDMTGISHQRLATEGPIQWPCDDQDYDPEASKRLYMDHKFHTADGRAKFVVCHSKGLAEPIDINYPFVLTVGRLYGHWHTLTRTGRTPKITQMHPEPFIEVHPKDAAKLGVVNQSWLIVRSRRGEGKFQVKVTRAIAPGTVFVPMHWGALWAEDAEANNLTHHHACPDSKQPELKACAVQLIPMQ